MKVRKHGGKSDKIELQMTAMIDVVFQLLVFFIMTFNVVESEGDFAIKLPGAPSEQSDPTDIPPVKMKVTMTAGSDGALRLLTLDGSTMRTSAPFDELHAIIRQRMGDVTIPAEDRTEYEVEIQCDYGLKYENVISAITAVGGYPNPNNRDEIITLIDKVRFAPPTNAPE